MGAIVNYLYRRVSGLQVRDSDDVRQGKEWQSMARKGDGGGVMFASSSEALDAGDDAHVGKG
jgi:hypothetical protein